MKTLAQLTAKAERLLRKYTKRQTHANWLAANDAWRAVSNKKASLRRTRNQTK